MNAAAMNNKVAARARSGSAPRRNSYGVSVDGGLFVPTGQDNGEVLKVTEVAGSGSLESIPGTPTNALSTPQPRSGATGSNEGTDGTSARAGAVENSV